MSCRATGGCGTSPPVSWADPHLFPGTGWEGTGWNGPKLCQERHRDVPSSRLCPVEVRREALGALLANIPNKFQREGRVLEEHLRCRARKQLLPGLLAAPLCTQGSTQGTRVPGLGGHQRTVPSQQGHWAPLGDPGHAEQPQDPHARYPPDPPQSTRLQQGEGATSSPGKDQTQAELLPWEFQGEEATGRGMLAPLGLCDVLAMGMRHHRTQKVSLGWRWPLPLPWEKEPLPCCVDRAWMQLDTASRTLLCCEIWLPFSHL